jgi:hypothetical protein
MVPSDDSTHDATYQKTYTVHGKETGEGYFSFQAKTTRVEKEAK